MTTPHEIKTRARSGLNGTGHIAARRTRQAREEKRREEGRVEATNGQRSKRTREQTSSETGAGGERKRN